MQGKIRRKVDIRIASYAIDVLKNTKGNHNLAMSARFMAASSLQMFSGLRALMDICRASASSDAIRSSVEPAVARRVEVLFEALAESLQQAQNDALQELLETVLVFAAESMEDEPDAQHSLLVWAASLGLDLAPIAVHEDDDEDLVPIVEPDSVPTRKKPPPRRPPAQHAYHRERLEDLVAEAIATGMQKTRARLVRGRIEIMGQHPKRGDVHLKWLKTSMQEAESLVLQVNQEIQKVEAP